LKNQKNWVIQRLSFLVTPRIIIVLDLGTQLNMGFVLRKGMNFEPFMVKDYKEMD